MAYSSIDKDTWMNVNILPDGSMKKITLNIISTMPIFITADLPSLCIRNSFILFKISKSQDSKFKIVKLRNHEIKLSTFLLNIEMALLVCRINNGLIFLFDLFTILFRYDLIP